MNFAAYLFLGVITTAQLDPLVHTATLSQGLESPARLAVTPGQVFVADAQANAVVRFDLAGTYVGTWSEPAGPVGIAVHPDGRVFVSRRDDAKVGIYDASFNFTGFLGDGVVTFVKPTDLAVDAASGRIYVVDSGADNFYAFEANGALALIVGIRGNRSSEFKYPTSITYDPVNDRIIVGDQDNFRVQVFMSNGLYVRRFGYRTKYLPGGISEGWMPRTLGVAADGSGRIYAVDAAMSTLRIFAPDGAELGKVVDYGTLPGELQTPGDVAVDATGRVFITNSAAGTVEIYAAPVTAAAGASEGTHYRGSNSSEYDLFAQRRGAINRAANGGPESGKAAMLVQPGGWDPPHMEDDLTCSRCHDIDGQPGGHLGLTTGQELLCRSCHTGAGQAFAALYRPTANLGMSHAWDVDPVNAAVGSVGPTPGGAIEEYLAVDGKIKCATCHDQHNNEAGSPFLRAEASALCRDCHVDHIGHTPAGTWQPTCLDCHEAHDPTDRNLSLIDGAVHNQTLGVDKTVVFTATTGPNSFDDGDPAANDGICQVCHTATTYHMHDGTGAPHNDGVDCTSCHPHENGFMAAGGDCTGCHAGPQDNGDNIPVGGRRGVVGEFPVGDAHAHYGAELTSGACTVCHSTATHMNGYIELIDADDGSLYTFVKPDDLMSDPDVSDFCASCHDADGATRLASPMDPFGNGNTPPDAATKFQGSLQWDELYGDFCFGNEGMLRGVNSHHDISDSDQAFSGAKIECLDCHGAHTVSATQPMSDPFDTTSPWTGDSNGFCIACHSGGNGPLDPAFPIGVIAPIIDTDDPRWTSQGMDWTTILGGACIGGGCSSLRGIDSCDYKAGPWYVDYNWTHSAHGPDSKRGWLDYSGAPGSVMNCVECHDPHGSNTPTNPDGNPYMIRDYVDGSMHVDDGTRLGGFFGPPWETFGGAREVVVGISDVTVDWAGAGTGLCNLCHVDWFAAENFYHAFGCTSCQTCHAHGALWGEHDWVGDNESTPCPAPPAPAPLTGGDPITGTIPASERASDTELPLHQSLGGQ